MEIEPSFIEGCFVIKPKEIKDSRGSFFETFTKKKFYKITGLQTDFVQDNQSISKKGVLRGLHFQKGTHAQAKLVRVISGEVLDVVVDLRSNSETYGKHFSIVLNDKNNYQLFIPRGFAHGFITLSERSVFSYKCDNYYYKSAESGIIYNDPKLNIDWRLDSSEIQLSEKDRELPFFKNIDVQHV
ncbi:dTDP-4-dehydrorhamnose 3,5-epimerase [Aquimarina aggregata]|uniref:dTDP-4-dehydrorhamnose 3,5-epimerase n=1 Tax=Aquimarina aggregata TaxID=1642818 RepID=A0A162FD22_9FLAO|nr:dTDP-4-dehydrorhamnose 3,5-epimerase [Aquimarina aggregata]KZS41456.1 dTDP-4-dehydrorhamnose 3,5-epimerase [Aquimarina aggregata]